MLQERVQQRIDEQFVDVVRREVSFPQVVEQLGEVPKFSSHDRSLQRAVEQIDDALVPRMRVVEEPVKERLSERIVEQIVDVPDFGSERQGSEFDTTEANLAADL